MDRRFVAAWVALAFVACGSGDTRTIQLVPVDVQGSQCGVPVDGRTMRVVALGDFPASAATGTQIQIDPGDIDIDVFPAATRQLTVEVFGNAGARRAIGKTIPFEMEQLDEGDTLYVFMTPPSGFCPSNAPNVARSRPLLARAGHDVLVAGGVDGTGAPVSVVELYSATSGAFIDLGDVLYGDDALGLIGAAMTTMPDGRVLIVGGAQPAYQLYDPSTGQFAAPLFLPGARAHHTATPIGGSEVLLAGGCASLVASGACEPASAIAQTRVLDVSDGTTRAGPTLAGSRFGGAAFSDANGTVVLIGGVDELGAPSSSGERIDVVRGTASSIDGVGETGAELAAGGIVISFAPSGAAGTSNAVVIPPASNIAVPVALAPAARAGATMTALEDGRVVVIGGVEGDGSEVVTYQPVLAGFRAVVDEPAMRRSDHGAAALDDGTVLVVGGLDEGGDALGDAWVFRPELTGPFTADVSVSFGDPALAELVVPSDPSRSRIVLAADGQPAHYLIESSGGGGGLPSEWVVIAGPMFRAVELSARLRPDGGGVAVLLGFVDAANYVALVLLPGQAATVFAVVGGVAAPIDRCDGQVLTADQLRPGAGTAQVDIRLDLDSLTASVGGTPVLACANLEPFARGHLGAGVIGDSTATLRIDSLLVSR